MRESKIEKKVCEYAESLGFDNIKLKTRGYPDREFLQNGFVFFIEFKQQDKKPDIMQTLICDMLKKQKFDVFVCDNIDQGIDIIDGMFRKLSKRSR